MRRDGEWVGAYDFGSPSAGPLRSRVRVDGVCVWTRGVVSSSCTDCLYFVHPVPCSLGARRQVHWIGSELDDGEGHARPAEPDDPH